MKGIVFTEFLEMVESTFGLETVDYIVENSDLKSEGVYTSVGTYDFIEMVNLITKLSEKVNIPVNNLIYEYGKYFFNVLTNSYPEIFKLYNSPLNLLSSIESHIHVHVRKIYPEAELPTFEVLEETDSNMKMIYKSERAMYMFALALIEKTFEHYHDKATVSYEKLNEEGTKVKFEIEKVV
ncbi:heme NO-binding domain-containing protein [Tenacibaculum sp. IB213877]|uniref:heme NO-binding domain-containing protein n=1 Tax=Tenacibaculum sp. IB213877 TaxID=3097351 RepID=UPI002A5AA934|nr:heme NO-binding domain-containing protein [Tenacibaculum sp. IB213877]MDY0781512.1 heme NO-binding domain-containing protein [Tenacibaculum sp. IB213877]